MKPSSLGLLLIHACCWSAILHAGEPQEVPVDQLGKTYQLIGKLGVPLGDVVHVEGVVVEGKFKGYEGGPNLRVQRIDGKATQKNIQIQLLLTSRTGARKHTAAVTTRFPSSKWARPTRWKVMRPAATSASQEKPIRMQVLPSRPRIITSDTQLVIYKAKLIESVPRQQINEQPATETPQSQK